MEVCLHSLSGFKTFPECIHDNLFGQDDASRSTGHLPMSRFCAKAATADSVSMATEATADT